MKNRAIIFSKNLSCMDKVRQEFSKRGLFDFSLDFCTSFQECLAACENAKENCETTVVVCKNENIDKILEKITRKNDELSLLFNQSVQLSCEGKKMLFVPSEVEFSKFFDEFLQSEKAICFTVFGKTASFVESKMDTLEISYEIITKSTFLHIIRTSQLPDEKWLKDNFENVILADDLGKLCEALLQKKGLTLALSEQNTAGRVLAEFETIQNLKKAEVLLSVDDFLSVGVKEETLQNFGIVSKESVFELCKKNLAFADISMCIVGDETGKTVLALGDKSEVHVFSSVFQSEAVLNDMRDFALYRLFSFLNSDFAKENVNEKE